MNRNHWELYKESKAGQKTIAAFTFSFTENNEVIHDGLQYIFDLTCSKQNSIPLKIKGVNEHYKMLHDADLQHLFEDDIVTREEYEDFLDIFFAPNDYRYAAAYMDMLSIALMYFHPFFIPMLMPLEFYKFQSACNILNIDLPPIPHTNDYRKYLLYYYDICHALNSFASDYDLSREELCACVYDYAINYLNEKEEQTLELPAPTNIWLVGADKLDIRAIEKDGLTKSIWQCNEQTRRGDIIVMYARTPYSCIHSIWRASSGGIFNPFDYFHCRTTVQDMIKVPAITIAELKAHPYFSQLPIVRKNLQGVNGVELSIQDYHELLLWFESKGCDISTLPKVLDITDYNMPVTYVEKDVEEQILVPFLEKIGYCKDDYVRQLMQKFGRGEKAIPDFVFFPKEKEKHLHIAPFIIEAKYDFMSAHQRQKDYAQALSYAIGLHAPIFGLCDKERLIIYKTNNSNFNSPIFENHWAVINTNPEVFQQIKKLIGKETIKTNNL